MLRVAFAGTFSASLAPPVRAHLEMPCDVILADEVGIVSRLSDVDVLVTFSKDAQWSLYEWVEMIAELGEIFGRDVDLLSTQSLRNPFRRLEILKARETLYAA